MELLKMKSKDITDLLKLFWNFQICALKKHIISDKDWESLTPLLPEIDACCTRCGYPFTIYLDEKGKTHAKSKYDDGGF